MLFSATVTPTCCFEWQVAGIVVHQFYQSVHSYNKVGDVRFEGHCQEFSVDRLEDVNFVKMCVPPICQLSG
jgi:hypothetical protein